MCNRITIALLTISVWFAAGSSAAGDTPCFAPQDSSRLSFEVIVQAPPPRMEHDTAWRFHPASGAASMDISSLNASQTESLKKYWFLWANRCHALSQGESGASCGWNPKGNVVAPKLTLLSGEEVRTYFTTFEAANICTLIQADWALGASRAEIDRMAAKTRLSIVDRPENALANVHGNRLMDKCLLPQRLGPMTSGVVLDYEVQDRRTPRQTEDFLLEFAKLVKARGKRVILFSNPLDAPTQRYTSITTDNLQRIAPAFDAVGVMLWSKSKQGNLQASARTQLDMLKGVQPSHIMLVFELNNTSMADAQFVHDLMLREHYAGVMLWRNYAEVGGSCTSNSNRKLSCLLFGRCS